ncbi:MAG: hypothetical protein DDT18_01869 [Actinobacteria bacterium]|nr:hypothetical protein [Actinomycetota bacterium]
MDKQFELQDEISLLEQRLQEKKRALADLEQLPVSDKEILKEIIKERMEKEIKSFPPSLEAGAKKIGVPSPVVISKGAVTDTEEEKIKNLLNELIDIALKKNIPQAVKEARKSGNAYLIDRLHDELVDKLYEEILKRKQSIA